MSSKCNMHTKRAATIYACNIHLRQIWTSSWIEWRCEMMHKSSFMFTTISITNTSRWVLNAICMRNPPPGFRRAIFTSKTLEQVRGLNENVKWFTNRRSCSLAVPCSCTSNIDQKHIEMKNECNMHAEYAITD
jgi:hypothetical protein